MDNEAVRPEYSVVIPVFNEEECLQELHERLSEVMVGRGARFEVIYVNDGSTDGTRELLDGFAREDERVRVVTFARNFGQHPAVFAGFRAVRGNVVITLDADLQNPPEEIPKLLDRLGDEVDVVAGVRSLRHDSILRRIPSRCVNWMISRLTGVPLRDYGCLLRAYRRSTIEGLLRCPERNLYFTALISWLGARIVEIDVDHAPRAAGSSKYGWLKLIRLNFDLLTGYSIFPIQLISFSGLAVATIGFLCSVLFLGLGLLQASNAYWIMFALSALSFLFGLQLFALGFIGEYIGRILIEVKQRPFYVLREDLESEEGSQSECTRP